MANPLTGAKKTRITLTPNPLNPSHHSAANSPLTTATSHTGPSQPQLAEPPQDASVLEKSLHAGKRLWNIDDAIRFLEEDEEMSNGGDLVSYGVIVGGDSKALDKFVKNILQKERRGNKIAFLRFSDNKLVGLGSKTERRAIEKSFRANTSIIEIAGIPPCKWESPDFVRASTKKEAHQCVRTMLSCAERNRLVGSNSSSWFVRQSAYLDYSIVLEGLSSNVESIEIQYQDEAEDEPSTSEPSRLLALPGIPWNPSVSLLGRWFVTRVKDETKAVELFQHAIKGEAVDLSSAEVGSQSEQAYMENRQLVDQVQQRIQSRNALAFLAAHIEKLANLKGLSLNGIEFGIEDLQALVALLSSPAVSLTSLFITEADLEDHDCQNIVEALLDGDVARRRETLKLLDLSDNQIKDPSKSKMNLLLSCKKALSTVALSRNPVTKQRETRRVLREQYPHVTWFLERAPKNIRSLLPTTLGTHTTSIEKETLEEHTRRRFKDAFADLQSKSSSGHVGIQPSIPAAVSALESANEQIIEPRQEVTALSGRVKQLEDKPSVITQGEEKGTSSLEDLTTDIEDWVTEVEGQVVVEQAKVAMQEMEKESEKFKQDMKELAQIVVDQVGLAKGQKELFEEIEAIKKEVKRLEEELKKGSNEALEVLIKKQKKTLKGIIAKLDDVSQDVLELRRLEEIEVKRGQFLQQNLKFRLAYTRIVTALKNDMTWRAVMGSGHLNPDSYSSPPTYQGILKHVGKLPLRFFNKTGTTGVEIAFGAVGGACSIASVACSGLTFGGSLALELIPIALAMLTPVLTASTEFGCFILEKMGETAVEKFFGAVNDKKARKQAKMMVQGGSITCQDQLNMDLAFGFVYLWQSQFQFLTEASVIKFVDEWIKAYLTFVNKNETALSKMVGGVNEGEEEGQKLLLDDLLWKEIPATELRTIFQGSYREKHWANANLGALLRNANSKHLTARALILKTGIRYPLANGQWSYWSTDPDLEEALELSGKEQLDKINHLIGDKRLTRAWLYGYRTFPTEKQAQRFIDLHTNHHLNYTGSAIDLTVEALLTLPTHVSNRGKERMERENGRTYVLSVQATRILSGNKDLAVAVSPAIQRFSDVGKSQTISDCFLPKARHTKQEVEFLAGQYLGMILNPTATGTLFARLDKHPDQLRPQLLDLVQCNLKTTWVELEIFFRDPKHVQQLRSLIKEDVVSHAVVEKILEVCLQGKMQVSLIGKMRDELIKFSQEVLKSPFQELIEVMTKANKKQGKLFISFTLGNSLDWMVCELIITCEKDGYYVQLLHHQVKGQGDTGAVEKEIRARVEEIIGKEKIKDFKSDPKVLTWVEQSALEEMTEKNKRAVSYGIFVAELLRYSILFQPEPNPCQSRESVRLLGKEHQRLMRYYKRIGLRALSNEELDAYSAKYPDLQGLTAEKRDLTWHPDQYPIGPPYLIKEPDTSLTHRAKTKVSHALVTIMGRKRDPVVVDRLEYESRVGDLSGSVELLMKFVPEARDAALKKRAQKAEH